VPIESIPEIEMVETWDDQVRTWLKEFDLGFFTTFIGDDELLKIFPGYMICAGQSPRDRLHAVIYKDGKLWHDPNPAGGGIASVEYIDFIYPLKPDAWLGNMTLMLTGR
jgi:hypothetical protein